MLALITKILLLTRLYSWEMMKLQQGLARLLGALARNIQRHLQADYGVSQFKLTIKKHHKEGAKGRGKLCIN